MTAKIEALTAEAAEMAVRLRAKSDQLQGLSVQGRETREETAQRRTDVIRLQHELEEVRTDLYRLTAIRRDLVDRLLRTEIENQELSDRTAQLGQTP
jgi:chromosome segregation ATPase